MIDNHLEMLYFSTENCLLISTDIAAPSETSTSSREAFVEEIYDRPIESNRGIQQQYSTPLAHPHKFRTDRKRVDAGIKIPGVQQPVASVDQPQKQSLSNKCFIALFWALVFVRLWKNMWIVLQVLPVLIAFLVVKRLGELFKI